MKPKLSLFLNPNSISLLDSLPSKYLYSYPQKPSKFAVSNLFSKSFNFLYFRANPFPKVTDLFCRLPLFYVNLFTRGCSPWRPDAVMSTIRNETNSIKFSRVIVKDWTSEKFECFTEIVAYSRCKIIPRVYISSQRKDNSSQNLH